MSSCLFSLSFIGHILAEMKIYHSWVCVLNFVAAFLLLTTNAALLEKAFIYLLSSIAKFSADFLHLSTIRKKYGLVCCVCGRALQKELGVKKQSFLRHHTCAQGGGDPPSQENFWKVN